MLPFETHLAHRAASPDVEELAALFALGALPPLERQAYLGHLEACGFCRQATARFSGVADALPNALEAPAVPPGLKQRILAQTGADLPAQAGPMLAAAPATRPRRTGWRWPGWLNPAPAAALAMLAVAVAGLAVWNAGLQCRIKEQGIALAQQQQLLRAVAGGGAVSALASTEAAPGARGSLVRDPAGGRAFLLMAGLPSLPGDQQFQVWRIKGSQPVGVGTFSAAGGGEQLIVLGADFAGADAIGISIEPRGGSPAPTGPIVLLGTF